MNVTDVINLTPHNINIMDDDNRVILIVEPEEQTARIAATTGRVGTINHSGEVDIPVSESQFGEPVNLPNPINGAIFIVSRLLVAALPDRTDLYFPNEIVRDDRGVVLGCKSLSRSA